MSDSSATMEETLTRYRITAEQFRRMGEAGIFPDDARVELLDGEIVEMKTPRPPHSYCVNRLNEIFATLWNRAVVSVQNPAVLSEYDAPFPDVTLLRHRDDYAMRHPGPEDILLVVEVSDTSVSKDRVQKGRLYARLGIREYWIVDIPGDLVEVRRAPEGELWGEVRLFHRGEEIAPAAFPDFRVAVDEILPPPAAG